MKEQELLFLGLLNEGPKHGYQLKKMVQEVSSTFAGLKTDSIYYPLRKMLDRGLVTQTLTRQGKRPARYTYKITPKGKEEFKKLLLDNMLKIERPYFSIDLSLYFLNYIPQGLRKRYLNIRLKLLNRLKRGLKKLKDGLIPESPPNLITIIEHNQQLLDAEIKFITRLFTDR